MHVRNVTSVAMAPDNSSGSPMIGDHALARFPFGPNEALHARSIALALSKKMGAPSTDAQDQLGTICPWASRGRRQRELSLGYHRRPRVLNVHCPAIYPDCNVGESAFAMLATAMRRSLSYVRCRAVYSVMMQDQSWSASSRFRSSSWCAPFVRFVEAS